MDVPPMEPPRSRLDHARRWTAILCWAYATACLVGLALIRFASERWWPATLLLFAPRWIWATPLLILFPVAFALRPKLLWLPLVTGVLVLFALLGFTIPWRTWHSHPPAPVSLRILSCNGHAHQMTGDTLDELVSQYKPDIIALQDFWPRRMPQSLRKSGWIMRRDEELVVASRYPIKDFEDLGIHAPPSGDPRVSGIPRGGRACICTIELPTGPVTFVDLHLASAHEGLSAAKEDVELSGTLLDRNSARRREQSHMIRGRVDRAGGPVILAGDFNTPDDSPLFRSSWSGLQDAFTTAGFGFGITYARHRTAIRIDHVLCDPGWTIRSCRVGIDVGSGHHVLVADLER